MRAFINGVEGGALRIPKDSNVVLIGRLMNDDGSLHDLSTATVDLLLYTRPNRNVTVSLTAAGVVGTAAQGTFGVTIDDSALNFGPGRYYAFVRRTLAGVITWGDKPTLVDIF